MTVLIKIIGVTAGTVVRATSRSGDKKGYLKKWSYSEEVFLLWPEQICSLRMTSGGGLHATLLTHKVKTGMLATSEIVKAVAACLKAE